MEGKCDERTRVLWGVEDEMKVLFGDVAGYSEANGRAPPVTCQDRASTHGFVTL